MQSVSTENSDQQPTPKRRTRSPRTSPTTGAAASRSAASGAAPRRRPRPATRRSSVQQVAPPPDAPRIIPGSPPAATNDLTTVDLPDDRYFNRELSWLDFNARVLALAEDSSQPLLERAKFLAIFASNLDEFYMVRVAGLKRRQETGLSVRSADGLSPSEQLNSIYKRAQELVEQHARAFLDHVGPELEKHAISIVSWAQVTDFERLRLSNYFTEQVFPVLTPLAVDAAHPFPYISGLSLNLAVMVRDPEGGMDRFARIKVPDNVPRLVRVESDRASSSATFLPVEELIAAHLGDLFAGMTVRECHAFRVTRNADLEVEEDRHEDLLLALEKELARRRFGPPVRLEVAGDMTEHMLERLLREMEVDEQDVVQVPGLLDLSCLWQLYGLDRKQLKDRPFVPSTHPAFVERETPKSIFATLREGDVLVHHPYDSFSTSVQRFIEQAAADPHVLAIKQTLYRTSGDSPIVDALIDAAEAGKQVVALVEIKARFDEQANIKWARALEKAGVHVVYGLVGLKTHCKTSLVVRQEGSTIRRYCHIGTGNYNPKTARLYEDVGILTAEPTIGSDLTDLFNVLTGYARQDHYRTLMVAPYGVRRGIVERIDREIEHARAGRPSGVMIKVNSLVDEEVVDSLYRASMAGVPVDVLVRGVCALKPGVPGLSENIRVRSILGRFLEHSRLFHFTGCGEHWIGSADMMHRNLDRRVEVLVRVTDPRLTGQLEAVVESALEPTTRCWVLQPDGEWEASPADGGRVRDHQTELLRKHDALG
ncbi:RNA degradosome polyphosphate kinase [Actinosynnema pretiosum subsp. pretiosum]|uniref:Polyphosphate kinase n=1 Tax=Actinosynnema pretiosum subsp. pretiosum TaxID=103721 RepID=A0AA45R2R7_9PSEU|nr:RNA degradosome polyphosphate kinase [Actinosynnema mirum]QUF02853.1 RNA degradosome polyphosphate kinase [Actinosynnema pretiosum subsp. pretiosum]